MSEIARRLDSVCEALGIDRSDFIASVAPNAREKFYRLWRIETASLGYDSLQEIVVKYPAINGNYLLKGELPVLLTADTMGQVMEQHADFFANRKEEKIQEISVTKLINGVDVTVEIRVRPH